MTKAQAQQTTYLKDYKPSSYLIDSVELVFDLDAEKTLVKSKLSIRANPAAKQVSRQLTLDGKELELIAIRLNGAPLEKTGYQLTDENLIIQECPEEFVLEIETVIHPTKNTELEGLYVSNQILCTQCEPEGFRRITYFIDRPDIMSCYKTTLIADEKKYPNLLSNGNRLESKKLTGGKQSVTWVDPFKKPSYLFALVAGDFECLQDHFTTQSGRRVALEIFVEKGNREKARHAMRALKKAMKWDEEKYGREYDLDLYMIVAVGDFNAGAMENKGLNIFNAKYVLVQPDTATDDDFISVESVIAHEYFHNWTGNRITCRDWFQLSLKEGLTIFRDQSFTEDTFSRTVSRIRQVTALRNTQFPEDAGPLAHSVHPDSYVKINNFYTTTIYNKGAEVLRMIRTIIGNERFRKGMDLYFERYDGQAVTIEDLVKVMEEISGENLTQFSLWYSQAGTPVVEVKEEYDATAQKYTLIIKQSCPATPNQSEKKAMRIPIKVGLLTPSGKEICERVLNLKASEERFEFPSIKEKPIPSLLRNFSAPVRVKFDYSDDALLFLLKHDTDEFNRWEAGQKYFLNLIMRLIDDYNKSISLVLPRGYSENIKYLIEHEQDNGALLSEMLVLPTSKYLADQMNTIDVEGIIAAREFLRLEMGKQLKDVFMDHYLRNQQEGNVDSYEITQVGKRRLKNSCLSYLMIDPDQMTVDIALKQFNQSLSRNMTDALAALLCFANVDVPERDKVLGAFFDHWQNNSLVVEKWLSVQAGSKLPDTLERVRKLLQHPSFNIKNPNKVYSLIGSFCQVNFIQFHNATGEGYKFIADQVIQIDAINPQVAANLAKPLTSWKKHQQKRQELMRKALEHVAAQKNLSANSREIVSKGLQ